MANYRYVLRRNWQGNGGVVNFIMLNPSTADDVFDDATIRRCVGFAKRWGFCGLVVTNLFAFRATNPSDLAEMIEVDIAGAVGPENADYLGRESEMAHMIVCAWGDNCGLLPVRTQNVIASMRHRDLYCIRRTKKGNPAHPVRERYTDAPVMFLEASR